VGCARSLSREKGVCPWIKIAQWFQSFEGFAVSTSDQVYQKTVVDHLLTSPALRLVANWIAWKKRPDQGYPLHHLLTMWLDQECEDPRDRVFGVLGLTNWGNRAPLLADYSLSAPVLLITVLRYVLDFYVNASSDAKYGFGHTFSTMLRIEHLAEAKAAIQYFAEADWPTLYYM
jgi:hypothetical protein